MPKISSLSHDEEVFLAGSFKMFILADGNIGEEELEDLDDLYRKLEFQDYEDCLIEFEQTLPDREAFFARAEQITNSESQDLILQALYELSLHSGIPSTTEEEGIFSKLSKIWGTDPPNSSL